MKKKQCTSLLLALMLIITALGGLSVSAEETPQNAISVYSGTADYDFWLEELDGNDLEATIMTADQLMAFADLTLGFNFAGWTIKLGADMVINTGDASTWANSAPRYNWKCSTTWTHRFAGDFDGQGHVISGLYSKYGQECGLFGTITGGNTIQDVSVVNSYFEFNSENAGSDVCLMGGIVGYIDSNDSSGAYDHKTTTIKNVYVNATLFTSCTVAAPSNPERVGVGGIVGSAGNTSWHSFVFENVVFEGNISSSYRNTGGLIGAIFHYQYGNATIKGCSVNANIKNSDTGNDTDTGGLIGLCNRTDIIVEDCIIRGTMKVERDMSTSAFIGYLNVSSAPRSITANNVLLALRPIPTGDSGNIIFQTMLFRTWPNSGLNVNFSNIKYDSSMYSYPTEMKHIHKAGGDGTVTNQDFKATGVASADLKGQAVFTDWTAVSGDYPIPAGVSIPTIDLEKYQNAETTTPANPDNGGSSDDSTESTNNNNNNNNTNSGTNNTPNNNTSNNNTANTTDTNATTTDASAEEKSGCGSSMGFAGISVLALAAVIAVVPFKKKEEN